VGVWKTDALVVVPDDNDAEALGDDGRMALVELLLLELPLLDTLLLFSLLSSGLFAVAPLSVVVAVVVVVAAAGG